MNFLSGKQYNPPLLTRIHTVLYIMFFVFIIPLFHFSIGLFFDELIVNPLQGDSKFCSILTMGTGILFSGIGVLVVIFSMVFLISRGKGYPVSSHPPLELVTTGLYRYSRHPIYAGFSFLYLGVSITLLSFWNIILFWPLFTLFFIAYSKTIEEPVLIRRFNDRYQEYIKNVPLFIKNPCNKYVSGFIKNILGLLSKHIINKPLIIRIKNNIFFISYGILCVIGTISSVISIEILFFNNSLPQFYISLFIIISCCMGLLCSHLLWLVSTSFFLRKKLKRIIGGIGFVSWGFLFGFLLTILLFTLFTGLSFYIWLDTMITSLLIAHFFGRLGCMTYGCCYGKETGSCFSLSFTHKALKAVREGIVDPSSLYATQLFSAFYGLLIFCIIIILWISGKLFTGLPFTLCCILYGMFRFIEEWYRNQKRTIADLFSVSQIISVFLIFMGAGHLFFFTFSGALHKTYPPLSGEFILIAFKEINYPVMLISGLIVGFIMSYHRYEIGKWVK